MSTTEHHRIVGLQAEGFKRIKAVNITPQGDVVELTGENGEGKSSILDVMWAVLGGTTDLPPEPIRLGEESAFGTIVLSNGLTVTRTFTRSETNPKGYTTALKVVNAEGFKPDKPQNLLDSLVGEIAFDPLEFSQAAQHEPKRAVGMLQRLVGFDFAADDQANAKDTQERLLIGRERDSLKAQADAIVVDEDAPVEEVDEAALLQQLTDAGQSAARLAEAKAQREARRVTLENMGQALETDRESAGALRDRARQLREDADGLDAQADTLIAQVNSRQTQLDEQVATLASMAALPELPDTADLQRQLEEARRTNAEVAKAGRKYELQEQSEAKGAAWDAITERMAKRQSDKADAIAKADLGVKGLDLKGGAVLLDGLPFEQASQAQQLEASLAIAVAMNPKLRVVRIKEGAFLGPKAWERLSAFAAQHDVQVWVETVDSGRESALVIEDGRVVGAPMGSVIEKPEKAQGPAGGGEPRERHVVAAEAAAAEGGDMFGRTEAQAQADRDAEPSDMGAQ